MGLEVEPGEIVLSAGSASHVVPKINSDLPEPEIWFSCKISVFMHVFTTGFFKNIPYIHLSVLYANLN